MNALITRWPMPALAAWALAWGLWLALRQAGMPAAPALLAAATAPLVLAWPLQSRWRQALVLCGFPASLAMLGLGQGMPVWAWPVLLGVLLLAYPLRAWRDAPFFPTHHAALAGLDAHVRLAASARLLDAGCGAGHGLQALAAVWPEARLHGVEWSRPLAWVARWRCPKATIRRGDMWAHAWSGHELVYIFQRPESMARAYAKAKAELPRGAYLVSLEFTVPGVAATAQLNVPGRRPVWIYRL